MKTITKILLIAAAVVIIGIAATTIADILMPIPEESILNSTTIVPATGTAFGVMPPGLYILAGVLIIGVLAHFLGKDDKDEESSN